jgi:hypothetical protein
MSHQVYSGASASKRVRPVAVDLAEGADVLVAAAVRAADRADARVAGRSFCTHGLRREVDELRTSTPSTAGSIVCALPPDSPKPRWSKEITP